MKTLLAAVLMMTLAGAISVHAQAAQQPRKPSPELQKEGDYYVGNWKFTGETKASPFSSAGQKFDASERLEWMPGGFFLLVRSYEADKWSGVTVIGYDENKKVFTHTTYGATGKVEVMEGRTQGDIETWSEDGQVNGKLVKRRLTIKKVSPTLYTFKFEMAPEGGEWSLVYEGQAVKMP